MHLTRLIYASKVSEGVTKEDLDQIIDKAKENNSKQGVTGILVFSDKYFMQALEGGSLQVNKIYHKILRDERHYDPLIIDYREIESRIFADWNMKLFLETKINRVQNLKYSSFENFDPYDIRGRAATEFLKEIFRDSNK